MSLTIDVGKWYSQSRGYDAGPPWRFAWLHIGFAALTVQWGGE